MKKHIFLLACLLWAGQSFAQFEGTKADFDKIKASFPTIALNSPIPTLKSFENPVLADAIVKQMGMPNLRPSSVEGDDVKFIYRAIGYYDHDENYATFFYLSLIPKQPDYSPLGSLHLQVIDKKTLKAVKHTSWKNILSADMDVVAKKLNRMRVTSYNQNSEIFFKIEEV